MSNIIEHNIITARKERAKKIADSAKRFIWVTFDVEGTHHFAGATEDPNLADVSFLGFSHRHIFHFRVEIEVTHTNREIEFIQFKRWLKTRYGSEVIDFGGLSVEMIADDLFAQISVQYPGKSVTIEVSEDGENGCRIEYNDIKK